MEPLTPVTLDNNACKACRNNSEKKMSLDPDTGMENFEKGGNKEEYHNMVGAEKQADVEECTQIGWKGTASELVFFNLVEGFERNKRHPILD